MENLTKILGVVIPDVSLVPMAGHKVVVFENSMGSMKFKTILNPGDSPYKKKLHFFSPPPSYNCYAVTNSKLKLDFSANMMLAAQHQRFTIECSVFYHISNPEPMAIEFNTDPIRRIRDEIEKRLQQNILQSKIQLDEIQDHFYDLRDKIRPASTLKQIRDFAGEFGVIIGDIDFTIYKIPEKFLKPSIKKEDYYLEKETEFIEADEKRKKAEEEKEKLRHLHELRKIEHGHEKEELKHKHELKTLNNEQEQKDTHHTQEIEDVKSLHEFKREMPKRLITAIDKAIDSIDGAGSLERVADSALGVIDRVTNKLQNLNNTSTDKQLAPVSNSMKVLMVASSGPFDEAKALLLKILVKVEEFTSIQPEERKALCSCITHLLAEIQLEEMANPATIDQYFKKLNKHAVENAKIFTRSMMEQIIDIRDTLSMFTQQVNQLHRHTNVDFPKKCFLDQEIELSVQLTIEKPQKTAIRHVVPIPNVSSKGPVKLTLHVTAPGFHVEKVRKTMSVPVNDDSEKVIFKMKPLAPGNQPVEVEIYFDALRIGYFALEIQVEEVSHGQS